MECGNGKGNSRELVGMSFLGLGVQWAVTGDEGPVVWGEKVMGNLFAASLKSCDVSLLVTDKAGIVEKNDVAASGKTNI